MHFINAMLFIAMAANALFQESYSTEWNKKSTFTTDKQVEFPGIVLEPGTYVIRVKESGEKRSIVEILNQNEKQILATLRDAALSSSGEGGSHPAISPGQRSAAHFLQERDGARIRRGRFRTQISVDVGEVLLRQYL